MDDVQLARAGQSLPPLAKQSAIPVLALVGGIGSGKSTVADVFAQRGASVIDGDRLGHELLRLPEVRDEITTQFGPGVLDDNGEIDRRKLAAVVFNDADRMAELERLVHPMIRRRMREQIEEARRAGVPLVVIDAAILLEAGWNDQIDRLIFVDAPEEVRWQRASQRGWSRQEWSRRESAQMPLTQKRSYADHVLDNSSDRDHLSRQVDDLFSRWGLVTAPGQRNAQ